MLTVFPTIRNREILILNSYRVSNYLCYYGKLLYYTGIFLLLKHLSCFGLGVLAESPKSVVAVATYDQVKKIVCVISKFA